MLKLRLSMGGTKKRPVYKIVVADSKFPRDGRFIEKLGFFNPLLPKEKKERIGLQTDRIKYWLSQGAQPTTRVARLLGEQELIPMPAKGNNPMKAVPKKERKKEAKEESPKEGQKADAPKEAPKAEEKKADAPKEAPKAEEKKADAPKEAPKAEEKK
jgi:small subunit ribosomal protein S16